MRADPCEACGSGLRVQMEVEVGCLYGIVSFCWGCGWPHELVALLDSDGIEIAASKEDETEALDQASLMLVEHGARPVALRKMRDYACLRWSSTSNLRWLTLARKLEAARRRAVEPLRLVDDPDRVDLGPAHVELMAITRTEVTTRGHGTARRWVVQRRAARVHDGVGVFVESRTSASVDLSDALLEAARMDGVFSTTGAKWEGAPTDHGARTGGGGMEGPAAPGDVGEDGAA